MTNPAEQHETLEVTQQEELEATLEAFPQDPLYARQMDLEQEMRGLGGEHFRAKVERARERGEEASTVYGAPLMRTAINPMIAAIKAFLKDAASGRPGPRSKASVYLSLIDPEVAAFLTLRAVLSTLSQRQTFTTVARELGSRLEDEALFQTFTTEAKPLFDKVLQSVSRTPNKHHKIAVLNYAAKKFNIEFTPWPERVKIDLGMKLIEMLSVATGLVNVSVKTVSRNKTVACLETPASVQEWIEKRLKEMEFLFPRFMPTLIPPKPWTEPTGGGYHMLGDLLRFPLVRGRHVTNARDLAKHWPEMPMVVEAINKVQATAWVVNKPVLAVAQTIWERGHGVGALPARVDYEKPRCPKCGQEPSFPHECFVEDTELLKVWKQATSRGYYEANAKLQSKRYQAATILGIAAKFADEAAIYFPHQLDFRGRMYPAPIGLQPQGDDLAKSFLVFAKGAPIDTPEAAGWLMIHGANVYGYDKVSLDARIEWVVQNERAILEVAQDPLNSLWWTEADKPWQFLAFCLEWAAFQQHGYGFVSRLPVSVDGSCNGLQHFSAMLRDERGGRAVNLVPSDKPADIYQEVANRVTAKLRRILSTTASSVEAEDKRRWAQCWLHLGVDRGICKRPVMVVPYSGTLHACRDYVYQHLMDKHGEHLPWPVAETFKATNFLTGLIWETISEVVSSAKSVMTWLKSLARATAKEGLPVTWLSPLGFPVRQAYPKLNTVQIDTKLGERLFRPRIVEAEEGTIDVNDQVLGISPNFVHSMDAAALQLSVIYAVDEGINQFSMIHDAYACPAAHMAAFGRCIRDSFVDMYTSHDVLADLWAHLQTTTGLTLPPPPPSGGLDLDQVRVSEFFFA